MPGLSSAVWNACQSSTPITCHTPTPSTSFRNHHNPDSPSESGGRFSVSSCPEFRRALYYGMRAFCLLLVLLSMCFAQTHSVTDAEVPRRHHSTLLSDTHNDITSRTVDGYDI